MKKKIFTIAIIIIVDVILFECWLFYLDPDPSITICLVLALPFLFFVNIVIAIIMHFLKKEYTSYFIINSFVSVLLMYFLFGLAIERNVKRVMEEWSVSINKKEYEITRYKQDNTFCILVNLGDGESQGSEKDRGVVFLRNDTLFFLTMDSVRFLIHDGYIFNFKGTKKVKIKKVV